MLAFQETDHALLVEAVKCQQRSSEIAREGWRHYCGALADGVRDPQILEVFHGKGGILWVWVGGKIPLYANFIGVQGVNHMIEVFRTLNSFSQDGSTNKYWISLRGSFGCGGGGSFDKISHQNYHAKRVWWLVNRVLGAWELR